MPVCVRNSEIFFFFFQYLTVAKDIFQFLNNHFVMCNSQYVLDYVNKSISEIDVIVLAALLRDLDRETGKFSYLVALIMNISFMILTLM